LLSAVDVDLATRRPNLKGIRFIDDYEFAVDERSEAEGVASDLQSILSNYELALKSSKTAIIQLPHPFEPLWTSRLRTFLFRRAGVTGQRNDLTAYFDSAFTFAKQDPDENTLKFAIARLNGVEIAEDNWPIFQGYWLNVSLMNQHVSLRPAINLLTIKKSVCHGSISLDPRPQSRNCGQAPPWRSE